MAVNLKGKAAIVTGGSKGIGYAIAEALIGAGADVAICARNESEIDDAVGRLTRSGAGRAFGKSVDMRDHGAVKDFVAATVSEFGRLDILINNAGLGVFAPIDQISPDDWSKVIQTNLDGPFYASREAIPHLKDAGEAWIINIGSLAGKNPFPGGAAYNASKFGLLGFSEAMMLDVRHDGIRVSCIMPGSVNTYFNESEPKESDAWKIQSEDIAEMVLDLIAFPGRTLPSRVEMRPSRPPKKG